MVDNLSSQFFWVLILSWYIFSWTNIPFFVPWSSTAWVAFCTLSSVHTLFYGSCGRWTCTWRCMSFFNAIPNLQIKIVFIFFVLEFQILCYCFMWLHVTCSSNFFLCIPWRSWISTLERITKAWTKSFHLKFRGYCI